MKILYLLLLLPLSASAQYVDKPPPGYTFDESVCGNPCTSPNWTYYYPNPNGIASGTPDVIFKLPDPPSDPPVQVMASAPEHLGHGVPEIDPSGALGSITLLIGALLVACGYVKQPGKHENGQNIG